jgi:hypothetical protein
LSCEYFISDQSIYQIIFAHVYSKIRVLFFSLKKGCDLSQQVFQIGMEEKPMTLKSVIFTAACVGLVTPAAAEGLSHLPLLSDIAPEAVAISPHVPNMGAHWAEPANLPLGPIYCEIEGRVVCIEYMFLASQLASGADWTGIATGMQTPPVSRIDMEYKPEGVGPFQEPLYQLHIYFAQTEVLAAY